VQNEDTAENNYEENSKKSSIYLPVSSNYEETTINKKPARRKRRRSSSTSQPKKRRKSQEVKPTVLNDKINEEDSKKANSVDEKISEQKIENKQEQSGPERSQLHKFKTPLLLLQLMQQHHPLHQKSSISCQLMQQHPLLHHKSSILCATLQRLENVTANQKKLQEKPTKTRKPTRLIAKREMRHIPKEEHQFHLIHIQNIMKKRRSHLKKWELWLGKSQT